MSSTPTTTQYADLKEVKQRLNIPDSITSVDEKVNTAMREADAFVNTQVGVHANTPLTNPDAQIISLASGLASALYNVWQSPAKDTVWKIVDNYQKQIGDHIKAFFAGEDITGHTGDTFSSTNGITGFGSDTSPT
ncbi:hypothetical protein IIB34_00625 [PVC group bacterium]|nr:hypothetical protein [PVC group bacterium]